jgi:hypothetical protein
MSKHQIFLVHGMGNLELGWSDGARKRKHRRAAARSADDALTATDLHSDAATKVIQAAGAPGGDGLLATHVLDVVAFRFLMPIAQTVTPGRQR